MQRDAVLVPRRASFRALDVDRDLTRLRPSQL